MTYRYPISRMWIALPVELKSWVEGEAERNERSLNYVVVRAIKDARERQLEKTAS